MVQELTRLPDWRERLMAALGSIVAAPFAWSTNDCVSGLACSVVEALTGLDLRADLPAYDSPSSARAALRQRGFEGLPAALRAYFPEVPAFYGRVGDLALLRTDGGVGYAIGMVNTGTILIHTPKGLGHVGWADVVTVFQIGTHEKAPTP